MKIKLSIKTVQQYANKPLIRHLITLKEVNSPILLYIELQNGKIEFTSQRYNEPEKAKRMRDRIYNKGWRRTADFGKGYDLSVLEQLKEVESVLAKRLSGGEEFAAIECLNFLISSKKNRRNSRRKLRERLLCLRMAFPLIMSYWGAGND